MYNPSDFAISEDADDETVPQEMDNFPAPCPSEPVNNNNTAPAQNKAPMRNTPRANKTGGAIGSSNAAANNPVAGSSSQQASALRPTTAAKSPAAATANEPLLFKQKNGLPRYSVILRPEITELLRLFFGTKEAESHFGVEFRILQNELIVDRKGDMKRVDAIYPEPIDNENASERCERAHRFLQSWHANNARCLDKDEMESEKSLGKWLLEWKNGHRS